MPLFLVYFIVSGSDIKTPVYVLGYNPVEYKYMFNKFGLYFCSNSPFFCLGIEPFTLKQYYKVIQL